MLVLLGIAGIFLPLLPGVPFLIIAGFLFGIVPKNYVLKILKALRNKKNKNSFVTRIVNYILIRYIHNRKIYITKMKEDVTIKSK